MTKFTVGIVDDEKNNREYIALLLQQEFPEIEVIFKVSNLDELRLKIAEQEPDILYLDIQLKDGLVFANHFIHHLAPLKIFITAYEKYALEAAKSHTFDYLLKPINHNEFVKTTQNAINHVNDAHKKRSELKKEIHKNYILDVPVTNGYKRIDTREIIYCEADSSYTYIYFPKNEKLTVSKPLGLFEEILPQEMFFRIHSKFLINLDHYKEYKKGKGGQVMMSDGAILDISTRKRNEFLQFLQRI